MTMSEVLSILQGEYSILEGPTDVPHGKKVKFDDGTTVTVFDKGSYLVQGKNKEEIQNILDSRKDCQNSKTEMNRNVFVVYGHDKASRNELQIILQRWKLNPLILEELPSKGQTIIEKLEENMDRASFAIVLLTPDDEGKKAGAETGLMGRARQNVILEMGMLLAKLGRDKVALLYKDPTTFEIPSDMAGLMYISFKDSVEEAKNHLAKEIYNSLKIVITPDIL